MTINPIIVQAGGSGGVPVDDVAAIMGRTVTTLDLSQSGYTGPIGDYAFYNCSKLTTLVLPAGLTGSIGTYAFYGCSRLTTLVLPAGLTGSIGTFAFAGCSKLTTLVLPAGLTGSIGTYAFYGCSSLTTLVLPGPTLVPLSSTNAFTATTCSIYVPAALVGSYKAAANWSTLAGRIYAIEEGA